MRLGTARVSTVKRLRPVGSTSRRPRHGEPAGPGATCLPSSAASRAARSPAAQAANGISVWSPAGCIGTRPKMWRPSATSVVLTSQTKLSSRTTASRGVMASDRPLSRSRPDSRALSMIARARRSRRRGSSPSATEYSSSSRSIACSPGGNLPALIGGVICPMVTAPSRRFAAAASPGLLTMNG